MAIDDDEWFDDDEWRIIMTNSLTHMWWILLPSFLHPCHVTMPSLHYAISFFKVSLLLQPAVPTFMDNRHILDNHDSGCYRDTPASRSRHVWCVYLSVAYACHTTNTKKISYIHTRGVNRFRPWLSRNTNLSGPNAKTNIKYNLKVHHSATNQRSFLSTVWDMQLLIKSLLAHPLAKEFTTPITHR